MKENWTNEMKRKLDGHKMTPPAGLWEGISNEMGLEPASAPKSAIIRKLYWAAAVVILALVGFFAFHIFDDVEPQTIAKNDDAIIVPDPVEKKSEESSGPDEPTIPEGPTISTKPSTSAKPSLLALATPVETQQETNVETQQTTIEEPNGQESVEDETETLQQKQTHLPNVIEPAATSPSSSESSSKWTIGLFGSNGLLLAANDYVSSTMTNPVYYDNNNLENKYLGMSEYSGNYPTYTLTDVVSKHHIPVQFGFSLQYQFNNRLALHTGINYTYLKSEFSLPLYNNLGYNQKLSYLGVPIGLSWKIWSTDHVNIYLTGGTMVEKCVDANISDGKIKTRPWQWSVNAAAGAEYCITRQFGFYLEPSLGYYFDDGTSIEHYYKEHPVTPSIEFGLRLHLNE